jgi:hypothetical protein
MWPCGQSERPCGGDCERLRSDHLSLIDHLRRHLVGYLALMVALGGTAYALDRNSVDSRELAKDSVGTSELAKKAVGSSNIRKGAVKAANLDGGFCGFVGEILLLGSQTGFTPRGTIAADGRTLSSGNYDTLYSVYGNAFGGDPNADPPTFGVPNLEAPLPGTRYFVCLFGIYPLPD